MEFDDSLLEKYLLNELTQEELSCLLEWKKQTAENGLIFDKFTRLRLRGLYHIYNNPEKIESSLGILHGKLKSRVRLRVARSIGKYAAAILFLLSLTFYLFSYLPSRNPYEIVMVNKNDSVKKTMLSDGTKVWLNNSSTLKVRRSFNKKTRSVELEGEAYFQVAGNPDIPFIVKTDRLNVKVLGTSFNVKAVAEEKPEVVLVEGKVRILDNKNQQEINIIPGQRVYVDKDKLQVETVDTNLFTLWKEDDLILEAVSLEEIIPYIQKLYKVKVINNSSLPASKKYRYILNKQETLEEMLNALTYIIPITYTIQDQIVIIE